MPPLMLITDTTDTEDTMVDTVDTTDTPIEVIMADTGNVKPRLNPLLPPPLNPKLMPPLMLITDTTVSEDTMVDTVDTTDILTDTVTVWDTVDTTDTPMPVMAVITADGGNLFYTMSRLLKWK